MGEWPHVRFEELSSSQRWSFTIGPFGSKVTTKDYQNQGVPFIRGVNLSRGSFIDDEFAFISDQKAAEVEFASALPGDLVFTRKGTVGQVSMVPRSPRFDRYVISGSQMKARLDPDRAVAEFYYYWFRSPVGRQTLLAHAVTVGVPSIANSLDTLRNLTVPYPPPNVQRAIAEVIGALDDKIAVNERIARVTRQLGEAEFEGARQHGKQGEVELASVVEVLTRGIAPKYTEDATATTVVNQRCIRDGRVSLEPARKTISERVKESKLLRVGDVVVNSTGVGTLGRVARWSLDTVATVDSHVTIVRFDPSKVDQLCGSFAMLAAQPEVERLGEGSTGQTELSRTKLGRLEIALPPETVCRKLRPKLDALEKHGEQALAESVTLAELRDTLLPKLMSGELRVRDAERVVEDAT